MNKKHKLIANVVVFVIGLLISSSVVFSADIFSQPSSEVMKILSNAFLLPGAILTGLGALIFVSNLGYFGIFDFSFKQMFSTFGKKEKRKEFREKYPDFYTYQNEKKKEQAQFSFILYPGIIFMLLAVVFTILFFYV